VESRTARILRDDYWEGGQWSPDGTRVTAARGGSVCWIRVGDGVLEGCIEGIAIFVAWY
jgi:hypothetical protein